jgi:ubiquinone/menaquinone biosynthesis C-methylase UbiE
MQPFDSFVEKYDQWFETGLGQYVAHYEKELTLKLAQPQPGEKILDVGIGTGYFAADYLQYKVNITGIDISEKMLDVARARGLTNVFTGDAVSLDFPDEAFDLVMSITALEFIEEPEKAVSEMVRVCKKGGRVVVGTLGSGSWWALRRSRAARRDPDSIFRQAKFYSFSELKQMAEKFSVNAVVRGAIFAPPFDNAVCIFLGRAVEKICQTLFPFWGAFLIFKIDKE